ncbi:hypothetical protein [Nostoc sp. UHCC 0302]
MTQNISFWEKTCLTLSAAVKSGVTLTPPLIRNLHDKGDRISLLC